MPIVVVAAAAKLSPNIGSIQSAVAGTAICSSSEYGYRDADRSTITRCSPDHSVAKPHRSAAAATASMTERVATAGATRRRRLDGEGRDYHRGQRELAGVERTKDHAADAKTDLARQHPLTVVRTGIVVHARNPDAGAATHAVES